CWASSLSAPVPATLSPSSLPQMSRSTIECFDTFALLSSPDVPGDGMTPYALRRRSCQLRASRDVTARISESYERVTVLGRDEDRSERWWEDAQDLLSKCRERQSAVRSRAGAPNQPLIERKGTCAPVRP